MKHLSTKQLWIQEATKSYGIHVDKVRRDDNIADALTHDVPAHLMHCLVDSMSCKIQSATVS